MPHTDRRFHGSSPRDPIDLADVARRLLGDPPGRRGSNGSRLWWCCPFHPDQNPSFCVEPGKPWWRCFGCGQHGDAIGLVMKCRNLTFPQAMAFLGGGPAAARPRAVSLADVERRLSEDPSYLAPAPIPPDDRHRAAEALVDEAARRLWTPQGLPALEYLRKRGLSDATIRAARLGFAGAASPPGATSPRFRGVTIPWFGPKGLELLKVRQADGRHPRYGEIYRRQPLQYPGDPLRFGAIAVIVEGELDALLLGQELEGLAQVITMGPASSRASYELRLDLMTMFRLYVATDADPAGDGSARHYPATAIRVRPPEPYKDWTEAHQAGLMLRPWWMSRLLADPDEARARRRAAAARGDALRAAGEAAPLCWLPGPQPRWTPPPMPGPRDDGRPWFEDPS